MAADAAPSGGQRDARYTWLADRVCSSLAVREEAFAKLLQGDARWACRRAAAAGQAPALQLCLRLRMPPAGAGRGAQQHCSRSRELHTHARRGGAAAAAALLQGGGCQLPGGCRHQAPAGVCRRQGPGRGERQRRRAMQRQAAVPPSTPGSCSVNPRNERSRVMHLRSRPSRCPSSSARPSIS